MKVILERKGIEIIEKIVKIEIIVKIEEGRILELKNQMNINGWLIYINIINLIY